MYEISLAGELPVTVTASALLDAWSSVPDLAARILDLPVDGSTSVCREPQIEVRRIS